MLSLYAYTKRFQLEKTLPYPHKKRTILVILNYFYK